MRLIRENISGFLLSLSFNQSYLLVDAQVNDRLRHESEKAVSKFETAF
jgi:hypothetical protein